MGWPARSPATARESWCAAPTTSTSTSGPTSSGAASTTSAWRGAAARSASRASRRSPTTRPPPSGPRWSAPRSRACGCIGTITLNAAVGGLNPLAVEIAAREGARIVWLPTVDAVNETSERDREYPPGSRVPLWVRVQQELRELGVEGDPVPVVDGDGSPLPALLDVLAVVVRHGLVLATGPPRPRRDLRRGRRGARGGRARRGRHPSRVPEPGPLVRRPDRAGRARRGARALLHHAPHGQVPVGARDRRHPRDRRRPQPALQRPRPAGQPAGRGRARAVRRPPARRGPDRRGGTRHDRAEQRDGWPDEPPPARDRRPFGGLRLARRRRDRRRHAGRRHARR